MKLLILNILLLISICATAQTQQEIYNSQLDTTEAICIYVDEDLNLLTDQCIVYFIIESDKSDMIKKVWIIDEKKWMDMEKLMVVKYINQY